MAVNLAVAAGVKTALFDLDQQESAVIWADRRKAEWPHVEFLTERRLPDGLKAAVRTTSPRHHRYPASRRPAGVHRSSGSGPCTVPCRPSLVDLDAIRRTARLVKSRRHPGLCRFQRRAAGCHYFARRRLLHCHRHGLAIAPIVLRERSAFRAAWPLGKGVMETEPNGKAAQEIAALKNWVFAELQVCTPSTEKRGKAVANG